MRRKAPEVAEALWAFARAHAQQGPSLRTSLAFTRLSAAEALAQLRAQGFAEALLPSPSTMAAVLSRTGYRLRLVLNPTSAIRTLLGPFCMGFPRQNAGKWLIVRRRTLEKAL